MLLLMMVQVPLSPESNLGLHFGRHHVFLISLCFATLVDFSARFSYSNQFGIFRLYKFAVYDDIHSDLSCISNSWSNCSTIRHARGRRCLPFVA
jgi:hypothetical protein